MQKKSTLNLPKGTRDVIQKIKKPTNITVTKTKILIMGQSSLKISSDSTLLCALIETASTLHFDFYTSRVLKYKKNITLYSTSKFKAFT